MILPRLVFLVMTIKAYVATTIIYGRKMFIKLVTGDAGRRCGLQSSRGRFRTRGRVRPRHPHQEVGPLCWKRHPQLDGGRHDRPGINVIKLFSFVTYHEA